MCWPKKNKKYINNHGKLSLTVPAIQCFLMDPAHHCKSFSQDLFTLGDKRGRELGSDKIDCAHLKCNYTYWLCQNCNKSYEVFVQYFPCVIKHHFRNHQFCSGTKEGGWCKYKENDEMIAKSIEDCCYHDKVQEPKLYEAVLEIWQCLAMDKMLKQSHHPFWCQKASCWTRWWLFLHWRTSTCWAVCPWLTMLHWS